MLATRTFTSPLGTLHLQASEGGVRRVSFGGVESAPAAPAGPLAEAHLDRLASELEAYFGGATSGFSVALDAQGTDFQKRVWRELMAIPSGQTRSYLEVARGMGKPGASRAVGLANGANPIAIVVPCHRVIGSAGTLTGYAGELWRKQWLLDHERANAGLFAPVKPEESCVAAKRFRMPC